MPVKRRRLAPKATNLPEKIPNGEILTDVMQNKWMMMFAIAASKGWQLHHMDFKSAYINGKLENPIYMRCPKGYEEEHETTMYYKLHRTLYGLRESGKAWNKVLDQRLQEIGLKRSEVDPCVYWITARDQRGYVAIFVDDSLVTGPNGYTDFKISLYRPIFLKTK